MSLEKLQQAMDFRDNYESKVEEAVNYIKSKINDFKPVFGVVLGSGLGCLSDAIENAKVISYDEIPNFPTTTVAGHEGKLIAGTLEDISIIAFKGRKHYYEVADEPFNNAMLKVVFPVHVLAGLDVKNYFVTNAAGGLNLQYKVGDIMIIKSHLNFLPNPLLGRHHSFTRVDNQERVERFQPMNNAYDSELRKLLLQAGAESKKHVHQGVFMGFTGPTYETEAEGITFRDGLKADAVGMSTTPEVIVARNRGMKAVGMSCITDMIEKDGTNAACHEEVKAILDSSEIKNRLLSIVKNFFVLYRESIQ